MQAYKDAGRFGTNFGEKHTHTHKKKNKINLWLWMKIGHEVEPLLEFEPLVLFFYLDKNTLYMVTIMFRVFLLNMFYIVERLIYRTTFFLSMQGKGEQYGLNSRFLPLLCEDLTAIYVVDYLKLHEHS